MGDHMRDAARRKYQNYTFLPWVQFFFAYDEFFTRRQIWISQICHAHNCRAVQKNELHPGRVKASI